MFKPEYNILKIAGSSFGYKHSEESIKRLSNSMKGNKNAKNGLGRKRAEGAGSPSIKIEVLDPKDRYDPMDPTDLETIIKTIYPSMNETGKALGVPSGSIRMYFSRNTLKPYKDRYILKKL